MNYENYQSVYASDDLSIFEFISIGQNGKIRQRIIFMPTESEDIYSLALGPINSNGGIEDRFITDNGDRNKILATVVRAVEAYTSKYPGRWVYFLGSTKERTRLYRMAVGLNLEELSSKFHIYAEVDDETDFIPFRKNMTISAFIVKRRIL